MCQWLKQAATEEPNKGICISDAYHRQSLSRVLCSLHGRHTIVCIGSKVTLSLKSKPAKPVKDKPSRRLSPWEHLKMRPALVFSLAPDTRCPLSKGHRRGTLPTPRRNHLQTPKKLETSYYETTEMKELLILWHLHKIVERQYCFQKVTLTQNPKGLYFKLMVNKL